MTYIGRDLKERIVLLGLDSTTLAPMPFLDGDLVNSIAENKLAYEDIDEFDLALLCNALHCDPSYFINGEVKSKDFLAKAITPTDSMAVKKIKMKICNFVNDFAFVHEIEKERS